MRLSVSRPDPTLSPTARISVSYDSDIAGAAEVLLAILRHPPRPDEKMPGAVFDESEAVT
jgi:hypothetical protein